MSFDDTAREPDQTFSLNRDLTGELEYPTKYDADPRAWGVQGAAPPERRCCAQSSLLVCRQILGKC